MKRTRKFVAAEAIALEIGVEVNDDIYRNLEQYNYFWNSEEGEWYKAGSPDLPTNLIRIRLWADGEKVKQDCDKLLHALASQGFVLEERSEPYACRPPKQLESRIYLTFSRN